jgi:hypothetical protein
LKERLSRRLSLGFAYGERPDAQGVHRAGKLLREGFIDEPVPVDQAPSFESLSDDPNLEMRLAARARSDMSGMLMALVHDIELTWRKRRPQLLCDSFPDVT